MIQPTPNHLANAASPYLQQHAYNPVDWYPWGEEALTKARTENKPILLSIGYAACHWCHVMAHESFEDAETAQYMNEHFVNIKVDREERPDLDKIYQTTHALLTQQGGGWPLTIFLSPNLTPFYSGTYFPKEPQFQLPAFKQILKSIVQAYAEQQENITKQNAALQNMLAFTPPQEIRTLNEEPIALALSQLEKSFDEIDGGFDGAPKFPWCPVLNFLLKQKSPMVQKTLHAMAKGGIFDQLGGGFFRYSVDANWRIPHFEKMLYDNGQLLSLYANASVIFQEPLFAEIANRTAHWLLQQMQSPTGEFYASLDADSEGEEGKYYLWNRMQVKKLLPENEFELISYCYGLDQPPNVEHQWHFYQAHTLKEANSLNISEQDAQLLFHQAQQTLLRERNKRIAPARDDKILTAWNALVIKGLLHTGKILQQARYLKAADEALQSLKQHAWKNERLYAMTKGTTPHQLAFLDDYLYLMDALLLSISIKWHRAQFDWLITLTEQCIALFYDESAGAFYFTASDQEKLLFRPQTYMDDSIPAGNGVAVSVLLTLGYLLGEARYLSIAEQLLKTASKRLAHTPAQHASLLIGLADYLHPPTVLIIRADQPCETDYEPADFVLTIPRAENHLPGALGLKLPHGDQCAYRCQGLVCQMVEPIQAVK